GRHCVTSTPHSSSKTNFIRTIALTFKCVSTSWKYTPATTAANESSSPTSHHVQESAAQVVPNRSILVSNFRLCLVRIVGRDMGFSCGEASINCSGEGAGGGESVCE